MTRLAVALLALALLAAPFAVEAQPAGKPPRIGFVRSGPPADPNRDVPAGAPRAGLRRGAEHRHRVPVGRAGRPSGFRVLAPSWSVSRWT